MINLKEEELKRARRFDYLKLMLFGTDLPNYACRNIGEFLDNKSSMGVMKQVVVPRVVYFPHPETSDERLCLPIKLRDESGEINVYVRPQAFHTESGRFLVKALDDIRQGDLLVYVILRNGVLDPTIFGDGVVDDRIYLTGFWSPRIRENQKPGLSNLVAKLSDLIPDLSPLPAPVPVGIYFSRR
ncbi:hypothetical protein HYU23_01265 [Candidatus Woesearchaeota archaeon]|nr:hypothetical protein [Candidatus Woesearchaeota archaeon]